MQCVGLLVCLFVIISESSNTFGHRVNYCGARMCGNTDMHTFCMYQSGPGRECIGYIDAPLSKAEKALLLARFNRRRNDAAMGKLRGIPGASDMLKLRWIEELAREAQLWANQCRPPSSAEDRDHCRDLFSTSVGQCVASVAGEAPGLRVESMVDMWYMQSRLYKGNVTTYVPPESDRYHYADFAQMLWAKSYMVGCGRSRFMILKQDRLRTVERLVCNVAPAGPAPYRALWSPGAPAAACPPRSHPDHAYGGLCDYHFEIKESDVLNNTMTIQEHVLLNTVLETENNDPSNDIESLDETYLTNLAIVTMDDNIDNFTSVTISVQKRDIADSNAEYDAKVISKKKISLIGRPKTYNMAELNEIADYKIYDNNDIIEDVPKNFNIAYGDYNLVKKDEENETNYKELRTEPKKDIVASEPNNDLFKNNISVKNDITQNLNDIDSTENHTMLEEIVTDTTSVKELRNNLDAMTAAVNETLITNENSVEDYLTDPETMRQLQQAIDRAENEMQTDKITSKVRRELKEQPIEQLSDESSLRSAETSVPSEDGKKSLDAPMLKMAMKYLPYLQQYESVLGNDSSCSMSSYVLLILCVCSFIL